MTLTAVAATGYTFDGWYKDDALLSDAPVLTYTPAGDENIVAVFRYVSTAPFISWLESFATTEGQFDEQAYYCRNAREGDIVTLKVSTSDAGDALGLDYHNITLKYEVEGATVVYSGYDYNGSALYKDGIATDFMLAKGFNKVVTKVYYNGYYVGAFDPFYVNVQ